MSNDVVRAFPPFSIFVRQSTDPRVFEYQAVLTGLGETAYVYSDSMCGLLMKIAQLVERRKP